MVEETRLHLDSEGRRRTQAAPTPHRLLAPACTADRRSADGRPECHMHYAAFRSAKAPGDDTPSRRWTLLIMRSGGEEAESEGSDQSGSTMLRP